MTCSSSTDRSYRWVGHTSASKLPPCPLYSSKSSRPRCCQRCEQMSAVQTVNLFQVSPLRGLQHTTVRISVGRTTGYMQMRRTGERDRHFRETSSGLIPLQQFRYSLETVYCMDFCPTANWQIFVAIRHHLNSAQNKSGHSENPSHAMDAVRGRARCAARMYSVEESRKRSERQAQYRKRYKEKSRISH
jgi:hypothetical protein